MDSWSQVFSPAKSKCLTLPIQMQLSPKLKIFFSDFSNFLKSTSNFEHFRKRDEPHSWSTSEIIDCKKRGYLKA